MLAASSGYCECGMDRRIRKGCLTDHIESFTCKSECFMESDLYEELELDMSATERAVSKAFRKLSLKYHPDKQRKRDTTEEDREHARRRFERIREARDARCAAAALQLASDADLSFSFCFSLNLSAHTDLGTTTSSSPSPDLLQHSPAPPTTSSKAPLLSHATAR